jgi:hypothetical protein
MPQAHAHSDMPQKPHWAKRLGHSIDLLRKWLPPASRAHHPLIEGSFVGLVGP